MGFVFGNLEPFENFCVAFFFPEGEQEREEPRNVQMRPGDTATTRATATVAVALKISRHDSRKEVKGPFRANCEAACKQACQGERKGK